MGTARNIPGIPQIIDPTTTPKMVASALILTLEPTTLGSRILESMRCTAIRAMTRASTSEGELVVKLIKALMTRAVAMPR